jgi:hypothetical protein
VSRNRRRPTNVDKHDAQEPREPTPLFPGATAPSGDVLEQLPALIPPSTFVLPQEFIDGITRSSLSDFEERAVEELARRKLWIQNLSEKLVNAYNEIGRLRNEIAEMKKAEPDRPKVE